MIILVFKHQEYSKSSEGFSFDLNYDSQVDVIGAGSTFSLGVPYKSNLLSKSGLWLAKVKNLVLPMTQNHRWLRLNQELEADMSSSGISDLKSRPMWFRTELFMACTRNN